MKGLIKADSKLGITLAKANVQLKKASPTLCLVGGIVTSAVAFGLAIKNSSKMTYILDERKAKETEIKEAYEREEFTEAYTEEEMKADLTTVNRKAVVEIGKLYALPAGLYILAMVLFVEGNHIMQKRNAALSAAVAAAQASMAAYRDRVRSFVGSERENDIYNGARLEKTVNPETGEIEEHIVRDELERLTDRCFDECNRNWCDEKFVNQSFLYKTEEYLNQLLVARASDPNGVGFVFLNEVYAALGFDKTPEGTCLGWYYEAEDGGHKGVIDFGLRQMDEGHRLFANGHERSVWLNFNFDGDVVSLMNKRNIKSIA